MNTSIVNREGKLLVDYETGRVLRGDDEVVLSERVLLTHPFIWHCNVTGADEVYFAGPQAQHAARARAAASSTRNLDAVEYVVIRSEAGAVTLQKVED